MKFFLRGTFLIIGIVLLYASFYYDDLVFLNNNNLNNVGNEGVSQEDNDIQSVEGGEDFEVLFQRLEEKRQEINVSVPVFGPENGRQNHRDLQKEQIIIETNVQRELHDLPPLEKNRLLVDSAKLKIDDMFRNQYFAHDSPQGVTLENLAENVGYDFITIGENLAMGLFRNEADLVQAWMDSPSHRDNILNSNFNQIGVYAKRGEFDGEENILIVQHFGRSANECPRTDQNLYNLIIDDLLPSIDELSSDLEDKKDQIDQTTPKFGAEYNEIVEEYNDMVEEYNSLVEEAQESMNTYNQQVSNFNQCASSI